MHKRKIKLSTPQYINESEKRLEKVSTYGGDMYDNVLACRLLKNVNQSKECLIKVKISGLSSGLMKDQCKKIFSELSASSSNKVSFPED